MEQKDVNNPQIQDLDNFSGGRTALLQVFFPFKNLPKKKVKDCKK
jgi:hypothetical protein